MTLVESLKKFLTKLGGNPNELENNATSAEVIDAISEAYTDKEGTYTEVTPIGDTGDKIATITTNNTAHDIYAPKELPTVTSSDKLKTLQVNENGEWIAGATIPDLSNVPNGAMVVVRGNKLYVNNDIYKAPMFAAAQKGRALCVNDSGTNWTWKDIPDVDVKLHTFYLDKSVTTPNSGTGKLKDSDGNALTFSDLTEYVGRSDTNLFSVLDNNETVTTNLYTYIASSRGAVIIDFLVWDFTNSKSKHVIFTASFSTSAGLNEEMVFTVESV